MYYTPKRVNFVAVFVIVLVVVLSSILVQVSVEPPFDSLESAVFVLAVAGTVLTVAGALIWRHKAIKEISE